MKAFGLFIAATIAIVLLAGWALTLVWTGAEAARAIQASALVAGVVQLFTFGIMRLARRSNPIAAWGLGTLLRFAVFVIYAFVIVKAFGLASGPALISLAVFFFLSTLVEPLLLNV